MTVTYDVICECNKHNIVLIYTRRDSDLYMMKLECDVIIKYEDHDLIGEFYNKTNLDEL